MSTLLLSYQDLQDVVRRVGIDELMDQLIERLTTALIAYDPDQTEIPIRAGFHYETPVTGLIEWMPLLQRHSSVLMKVVGYHPNSPETRRLPTILSVFNQYDPNTGQLVAIVDGTFLTAMRTGAASAVASRILARSESRTLGLIGCGAQAVTQLHAIGRVFDLQEVLIYDTDRNAVETFEHRVAAFSSPKLDIRPASLDDLVATSDILCVATSVPIGQGPVFDEMETRPWLHVNAVGSDFPGKTELPNALLQQSYVCPDTLDQAIREGECQQLASDQIGADIVQVARRAAYYALKRNQRTVFDSTGWALEDQVAMDLLLGYAHSFGIGSQIAIESVTADPRDIYEFLDGSDDQGREGGALPVKLRS